MYAGEAPTRLRSPKGAGAPGARRGRARRPRGAPERSRAADARATRALALLDLGRAAEARDELESIAAPPAADDAHDDAEEELPLDVLADDELEQAFAERDARSGRACATPTRSRSRRCGPTSSSLPDAVAVRDPHDGRAARAPGRSRRRARDSRGARTLRTAEDAGRRRAPTRRSDPNPRALARATCDEVPHELRATLQKIVDGCRARSASR